MSKKPYSCGEKASLTAFSRAIVTDDSPVLSRLSGTSALRTGEIRNIDIRIRSFGRVNIAPTPPNGPANNNTLGRTEITGAEESDRANAGELLFCRYNRRLVRHPAADPDMGWVTLRPSLRAINLIGVAGHYQPMTV